MPAVVEAFDPEKELPVDPGKEAVARFGVRNTGDDVSNVTFRILGEPPFAAHTFYVSVAEEEVATRLAALRSEAARTGSRASRVVSYGRRAIPTGSSSSSSGRSRPRLGS